MKRIFLIVLDSCGCGAAEDAALFNDENTNTIRSVFNTGLLRIPNLIKMGLGNIESLSFLSPEEKPLASVGFMTEESAGKDTTTGHWEMTGILSKKPFPTYPDGFPKEIIDEFSAATGRGVLCNKPYSGTKVIADYGAEHLKTGSFIVYTSADSVFQIAAHEDVVPLEELYSACEKARRILCGNNAVGRVIARPFTGTPKSFVRTAARRDFSLVPPHNVLSEVSQVMDVIAVGKINDIFAGKGITQSIPTHSNDEGIAETLKLMDKDFTGLVFTNLVDFDMLYGHRNDAAGYAAALNRFDNALPDMISKLKEGDCLIITADHGCDPGDVSTDHTRENVPLIIYSKSLSPKFLGRIEGFWYIADFIRVHLGLDLIKASENAAQNAIAPYSGFHVGAALQCGDGSIYEGFNIENASYSLTVCAERTAMIRALADGKRSFTRMAVTSMPCGACRQFMSEFCPDSFEIITGGRVHELKSLLPESFSAQNMY